MKFDITNVCDYGHDALAVRLPTIAISASGVYLCHVHWLVEMEWRAVINRGLDPRLCYDILPWPIQEEQQSAYRN